MTPCKVDGCDAFVDRRRGGRDGYCRGHYDRKRDGRTIEGPLRRWGQTVAQMLVEAGLRLANAESDEEFKRAMFAVLDARRRKGRRPRPSRPHWAHRRQSAPGD